MVKPAESATRVPRCCCRNPVHTSRISNQHTVKRRLRHSCPPLSLLLSDYLYYLVSPSIINIYHSILARAIHIPYRCNDGRLSGGATLTPGGEAASSLRMPDFVATFLSERFGMGAVALQVGWLGNPFPRDVCHQFLLRNIARSQKILFHSPKSSMMD